jgi:hypothetical protein
MSDVENLKISFRAMVIGMFSVAGALVYAGAELRGVSDTLDAHTQSIIVLQTNQKEMTAQLTDVSLKQHDESNALAWIEQRIDRNDSNARSNDQDARQRDDPAVK